MKQVIKNPTSKSEHMTNGTRWGAIAIGGTVALIIIAGALLFTYGMPKDGDMDESTKTTNTASSQASTTPIEVDTAAAATNTKSQEDLLLYLIEEEKLAHDVYTVMHDTYGAKVFGNILGSEQTHQSRVLTLLTARGIADPRSAELGKFNNAELQSLYDQLIMQGEQSAEEAYKVGIIIEEKDIADITAQLATATDSDIVAALEALHTGSENHLRAFNRQLGKY